MKISIITVCKNPGDAIKRTVESVLAQTYNDIEYIIIDGASTDGTVEWLEDINSPDPSVDSGPPSLSKREGLGVSFKFLSEPDTGIYNAMNKGTALATGDFLLFLNAGDYLAGGDVIADVVGNIEKNKGVCDIYFGDIISEDPDSGERYEVQNRLKNINSIKSFFWSVPHAAAFIKKDALTKAGGYDENFKIAADYDFFVKAFVVEDMKYCYIPLNVSVFQTGGVSSNPANKKLLKSENLKVIEKYYGSFFRFIYNVTPMLVAARALYKIWLKFEKND